MDNDCLEVFKKLVENNATLAVAESFTGGEICAHITKIPGASKVLREGIVCYTNSAKMSRLGVSPKTIEKYGAVSFETVNEMLHGLAVDGADYLVATSGNAGPTAEKNGENGLCFIGVMGRGKTIIEKYLYSGNREDNIEQGVRDAFKMLIDII